jgi:hypothetical protein
LTKPPSKSTIPNISNVELLDGVHPYFSHDGTLRHVISVLPDEELLEVIHPYFSKNKTIRQLIVQNAEHKEKSSGALRLAAIAHVLSIRYRGYASADIDRHMQMAATLSSTSTGVEGILTDSLLAYTTFTNAGAFADWSAHGVRSRAHLSESAGGRRCFLFDATYGTTPELVARNRQWLEPFFTVWHDNDYYGGWSHGNMVDLLTLTVDACEMIKAPERLTQILHHLFSHKVLYTISESCTFSRIMCQSIYVLCVSMTQPVSQSLREALLESITQGEQKFRDIGFPNTRYEFSRMVLGRVSQTPAKAPESIFDESKMRMMHAVVFENDRFRSLASDFFCSTSIEEAYWRDYICPEIAKQPALMLAAYATCLLHFHWHNRRQEGFEYIAMARQLPLPDAATQFVMDGLETLVLIASSASILAFNALFDKMTVDFVKVVANLDDQPESLKRLLLIGRRPPHCSQADLIYFRVFSDDFVKVFPDADFQSERSSYAIAEVLALILAGCSIFFGTIGAFRSRKALGLLRQIGQAGMHVANPTQPQGLFRIIMLEAAFALLQFMAIQDRLGTEPSEMLRSRLTDAEQLCATTLHFPRFVLSALQGAIYPPAGSLYFRA